MICVRGLKGKGIGGDTSRQVPASILAALAAFSVYLALLNNFLRFEQYPLWRLEVLFAVLAGAAVAAVFGGVYQVLGMLPGWPRRLSHASMVAALVAYVGSLNVSVGYALFAIFVAAVLSVFYDRQVLLGMLLMSALTCLSSTVGWGQQMEAPVVRTGESRPSLSAKPAIVHILFDEHIGIDGLSGADPSTSRLRQRLTEFYLEHGFHVFGGAYSQSSKTSQSVPFILNFGQPDSRVGSLPAKANSYFRMLQKSGYRVNVLQSQYIDYCSGIVDVCTTYRSETYSTVAQTRLPAGDKAILITRKMVPTVVRYAVMKLYLWLRGAGYNFSVPSPVMELHTTPLNGVRAMRLLRDDLGRLRPGDFYFAHILLPHSPYVFRADCAVAPVLQWRQGNVASLGRSLRTAIRAEPLVERQDAYDQQTLCTLREFAAVLNTVEQSPAGKNAIIIVHGDHGSRISDVAPEIPNIGKLSDDALIANYSTLFAVRGPDIKPGFDSRHYPVSDLIYELVTSNFRKTGSHPISDPVVFVTDEKAGVRRTIPLPSHW
jgi:hypothetical protein